MKQNIIIFLLVLIVLAIGFSIYCFSRLGQPDMFEYEWMASIEENKKELVEINQKIAELEPKKDQSEYDKTMYEIKLESKKQREKRIADYENMIKESRAKKKWW